MWTFPILFAQGVDPTVLRYVACLAIAWTLGLAVASLVGGFLLRAATRLICNIDLPHTTATWYMFVAAFVSADFGVITKVLFDLARVPTANDLGQPTGTLYFTSAALAFLFCSVFFGSLITDLRKTPIGFGNGVLITLALMAVGAVVALLLAALFFAFASVISPAT